MIKERIASILNEFQRLKEECLERSAKHENGLYPNEDFDDSCYWAGYYDGKADGCDLVISFLNEWLKEERK